MTQLLIIDDEERIRKVIKIQLHNNEFEIYEADNKITAFEILDTVPVQIIICDIKMKDTNGLIILKELKKNYPDIPVIMLSGYIDKKISEKAKTMGCFDFITKPVRRSKLLEIINKAINFNKDGGL